MSRYYDYNASTPCDPRVLAHMLPFFTEQFANAGSTTHQAGRHAQAAVGQSREQVAELLKAYPAEIVFTGGATESNNLAILGSARAHTGQRKRILTSAIEHKSVLALSRPLQREGFVLEPLPVDSEGRLHPDVLRAHLKDDVLMVSVQAASNEIGTLQDVAALADAAHEVGAVFHTDATQWVGKLPVDVGDWDVDFLSLSAHKFYGPKGVGALYVQGGVSTRPLEPLLYGGGQEWGLRSGTQNVPGIVGLGSAAEFALQEGHAEAVRLGELRDQFEAAAMQNISNMRINGCLNNRLPHSTNLTMLGVDTEALMARLNQFSLSNGSACQSGALEPSHVLLALGISRQEAYNTLRISLGRSTTKSDLYELMAEIKSTVVVLRASNND